MSDMPCVAICVYVCLYVARGGVVGGRVASFLRVESKILRGWITSLGSLHKTRARQVPRGRAQRLQGVKGTDVW